MTDHSHDGHRTLRVAVGIALHGLVEDDAAAYALWADTPRRDRAGVLQHLVRLPGAALAAHGLDPADALDCLIGQLGATGGLPLELGTATAMAVPGQAGDDSTAFQLWNRLLSQPQKRTVLAWLARLPAMACIHAAGERRPWLESIATELAGAPA